MGVADYFFAQLDAISHDRKNDISKASGASLQKCQSLIIKYILREQHDGYAKGISKPTIFNLIDNFVNDHVRNTSKHRDLFLEAQDNVKFHFLGLANITVALDSDSEN